MLMDNKTANICAWDIPNSGANAWSTAPSVPFDVRSKIPDKLCDSKPKKRWGWLRKLLGGNK